MITIKRSEILYYDLKRNIVLVHGIGWVHNDYVNIEEDKKDNNKQ